MDSANLVKVGIRDADGNVETPWAQRLGNNLYRPDNTPFFAYGISADDIVEALPEEDGMLMFVRMVEKSGNRTVRVMLSEPAESEPGPTLLGIIKRLGCTFEGAYSRLICICVPPNVLLDSLTDRLTRLGLEWEYADPTYEDLSPGGA
ncbi:MAG TPA: DUF4265 domain-containing protein [Tepidisphaeraceae bacterium]|nr:DUF4265 domain-containing protein [Tepidisphaeraceae bacterium]